MSTVSVYIERQKGFGVPLAKLPQETQGKSGCRSCLRTKAETVMRKSEELGKIKVGIVAQMWKQLEREQHSAVRLREWELELKALLSYVELLSFSLKYGAASCAQADRWTASCYSPR